MPEQVEADGGVLATLVSQAMLAQLKRRKMSQEGLAAQFGVTQGAARQWLLHPERLTPERMFAIERALGVAPGTFSSMLGYVPHTGQDLSIPAAIHNSQLPPVGKAMMLEIYEVVLRQYGLDVSPEPVKRRSNGTSKRHRL